MRRGFALATALWMLAMVGILLAAGLPAIRAGADQARNRITLRRAAWARDACVALLLSRFDSTAPLRGIDSTGLGGVLWCSARVTDPAGALNLNVATESQLRVLLGSDSAAAAALDWRDQDDHPRSGGGERADYARLRSPLPRNGPFRAVEELRLVKGVSWTASLNEWLTVEGAGAVNVNVATLPVLIALGLPADVAQSVVSLRSTGWRAGAVTDLVDGGLNVPPWLTDQLTISSALFQADVVGGAGSASLLAHRRLILRLDGQDFVPVRQEVW